MAIRVLFAGCGLVGFDTAAYSTNETASSD